MCDATSWRQTTYKMQEAGGVELGSISPPSEAGVDDGKVGDLGAAAELGGGAVQGSLHGSGPRIGGRRGRLSVYRGDDADEVLTDDGQDTVGNSRPEQLIGAKVCAGSRLEVANAEVGDSDGSPADGEGDEAALLVREDPPAPGKSANWRTGMILLTIVVLIWTGSSVLVQFMVRKRSLHYY